MNNHRSLVAAVLALVLVAPAVTAAAQTVTTSKPIKVEAPKPKTSKFKGEVLHATRVSMVVRSQRNYKLVRTFTYDQQVAAKIGKFFDQNRLYQYGDRVEIEYLAGSDTALKIKGEPGQKKR